ECAYILKNSYKTFPEGTIHIVGVDSDPTPENQHIAVLLDNHYFIAANNGVIGLITSEIVPDKVAEIQIPNPNISSFPLLYVFVQVARHIDRGGTLEVVGRPFDQLTDLKEFSPRISDNGNSIIGSVIYIDNYGNVVTNIQKKMFETHRKSRNFILNARNKK